MSFDIYCFYVCFFKNNNIGPYFIDFPASHFFHLARHLGYLRPSNSRLALHHCNRMIIYFPKLLLMDIWVVSSSFAVTNSAANLLVHLSRCPCGRLFHRWIVIDVQARSIQSAWWRLLRRWDLRSQKGTVRPTSACSCSPLTVLTRDLTSTPPPPKGEGFWAEPTWLPSSSAGFVSSETVSTPSGTLGVCICQRDASSAMGSWALGYSRELMAMAPTLRLAFQWRR